MGNCFSDPSKPKGKGQRLGSGPPSADSNANAVPSAGSGPRRGPGDAVTPGSPPQTLGGRPGGGDTDPRAAALAAAEARAKTASQKGVSSANPKAGQLSAKLEAQKHSTGHQQQQGNERMMDSGQWN